MNRPRAIRFDSRSASRYFDHGLYDNMVTMQQFFSDKDIALGIRSASKGAKFWTVFDNFRLYYYGGMDINDVKTGMELPGIVTNITAFGAFVDVGIKNSLIPGEEFDSGGAGVISTVSDYMKLADALCNYGTSRNGERILSKQSVELMRTNSLNEAQFKSFDYEHLKGYGYGLGVRTMVDRVAGGSLSNIGEFGWDGAAGTAVYMDPEIGLSVVYAKHILAPRAEYYQPRLRNVIYSCL